MKTKGGGEREPARSDRRGFFRLGLQTLRDNVFEAARELGQANAPPASPAPSLPTPPPPTGRARPRVAPSGARLVARPPGALAEAEFLAKCTRCAKCVDACPEGSLFRAGPHLGAAVEQTPVLLLDQKPCFLCTDVPCAAACPTGALLPVEPARIRVGVAEPLQTLCLNRLGQPCESCVTACPFPDEAITPGPMGVPVVDPDVCTGCGQCVSACPAFPKALHIRPL